MSPSLLDRLRGARCDCEPFTPHHARCIGRLTNEAADEIERLRGCLAEVADRMGDLPNNPMAEAVAAIRSQIE